MATVIPTKARFSGLDVVALGEFESGDVLPVDAVGTITSDYTDSGAADVYVLTKTATTPTIASYVEGAVYSVKVANTNTGASTANIDGLGVKNIKTPEGTDPAAGDLVDRVDLAYDSANDWLTLRSFATQVSLATPPISSGSRNQVMNQNPLSQGLSQRVGMSSTLYTGNGTTQSVATGVDMATGDFGGFVWVKERSSTSGHFLFDTVRGATNYLASQATTAEGTDATSLTAFDSTGFSVGANNGVNQNTITMAAWSFQTTDKFTGTTNRNKAYTAHYNAEMGFSVVGYVGDGVAGHEIPHHLGREPELTISKRRDAVGAWLVCSSLYGDIDGYMTLDTTAALATAAAVAYIPSDETISVGTSANINVASENLISYNFASIEGVSKVGKYIGTGAAGNYVDCGFGDKSAGFVLVKNMTGAGDNWYTFDSSRGGSALLYPNASSAEATVVHIEFVPGGFVWNTTLGTINALNEEFLFLAFADNTGSTGETDYDYPTTDDTLTIEQDTLISFADGFSASGETNVQENVAAATTMTFGAGSEDAKYYVYKDAGGSYGTTEYRPLEEQDYSGVQTPNQIDPNLRTTAKHFDYESSTGVALASDEGTGDLAWNAFNNSGAPYSVNDSEWNSATADVGTLQYKGVENRILKSWRMKASVTAGRLPRRFTIEGSQDGYTWVAIDSTYTASDYTGNGVSLWGDLQSTSGNTTAYLYHRIDVTAVATGASAVGIMELEFNTELSADRYDVSEGVMYNYAGTAINRVYLGELRTDTDGDIINNTIVNYTPNKLKTTDAELHGDLIVRGEIANSGVATAWVNFDGTQNPPLIRSSYNVKDVVDLGTGVFEVLFETPMDNSNYSVNGTTYSAAVASNNYTVQSVNSCTVRTYALSSSALLDRAYIGVQVFGGKS